MFRRRKPDETEALQPGPDDADDVLAPTLFEQALPVSDPAPPSHAPVDTGLGVPPFRPAFPVLPKEAPTMARPPMPPSPSPMSGVLTNGLQALPPGAQQFGAQQPGGRTGQPPRPQASERRTLVVGRGISVQGVVQDAERLVVEGTVEATMIHAAELSIAQGGVFRGEVEVEEAEVAGTIDGTLTARGNLVVRATGKVLGTARCRRLQVEDGGAITGRIEMLSDSPETAPRAEAPRVQMVAEPVA